MLYIAWYEDIMRLTDAQSRATKWNTFSTACSDIAFGKHRMARGQAYVMGTDSVIVSALDQCCDQHGFVHSVELG